jgi:hypothetical protein
MKFNSALKSMFLGRSMKRLGLVMLVVLLVPIPALGLTFLGPWNFTNLQINAPTPLTGVSDFGGSTTLTVDMGKNGVTTASGETGSLVNPGAVSIFTATRSISIPSGGQTVNVSQTYQSLLQGATQQSAVYFDPINNNANNRIDPFPSVFNSQGTRFANVFYGSATNQIPLAPGQYNVVVRIKFKKDRFGVWDSAISQPVSPYTLSLH